MEECTPGGMNGTCEGVVPHMQTVVESPGVSLFCFSVCTADAGSEKPSHELESLQMLHENALSGRFTPMSWFHWVEET